MDGINHDADDEWKEMVFPVFDPNMRKYYGNGDKHISTIVFEVHCHPDNIVILKQIMSRIPSDDPRLLYSFNIEA